MSVSKGTSRYRDPSRFISPVSIPFDEASIRGRSSDSIQIKYNIPSNPQFTRRSPNKALQMSNDPPAQPLEPTTTGYAGITSWNANNGFLQFVARPCAGNTTDSVHPYDLQKTDSLKSLEDFLSVAENNPYTLIKDPRENDYDVSNPVEECGQLIESSEAIVVTSSCSSEDVFAGIISTEKVATNNEKAIGRELRVNSKLRKTQTNESNPLALSSGLPTARLSNVKHPKGANPAFSSEFEIEKEILTHRRFDGGVNREQTIVKNMSDGDAQTVNQANNVELTLEDFEKIMEEKEPNISVVKSASKTFSVSPSVTSNSSKSFVLKPMNMLKKSWSKLKSSYRGKKRKEIIQSEQIIKDWSTNVKPSFEQDIQSASSLKREPVASIDTLPTVSTKNSTVSVPEMPGRAASLTHGRKSRSHRHRISVTSASQSFASEKSEANLGPSRPRPLKGYIDDCSIVFSKSDISYSSEYSNSDSDYSDDSLFDNPSDDSLFDNPSKAVAQTATELLNPGSLRVLQEEFVAMFKPVVISKRRR